MQRATIKSVSLTLSCLTALTAISIQAALAGTVRASKVTSNSALIKWTSDRPYRKTKLRIKCLDNPVLDRVTDPVVKPKLSKEGFRRVKLKPGRQYKITVVGVSLKDERKQKPIGVVDLKTKGKKLDTSIDDQSKKVKIRVFKRSVNITWNRVSDFKAIKVTIKDKTSEKSRQSGWLKKRSQYTFKKLKKKREYLVTVEGKTEFGQSKTIKTKDIRTKM